MATRPDSKLQQWRGANQEPLIKSVQSNGLSNGSQSSASEWHVAEIALRAGPKLPPKHPQKDFSLGSIMPNVCTIAACSSHTIKQHTIGFPVWARRAATCCSHRPDSLRVCDRVWRAVALATVCDEQHEQSAVHLLQNKQAQAQHEPDGCQLAVGHWSARKEHLLLLAELWPGALWPLALWPLACTGPEQRQQNG